MSHDYKKFAGEEFCPSKAIYDPPQYIFNKKYHPQQVDVIHQIEVINQHFCVPVFKHVCSVKEKDVFCSSARKRRRGRR
ncbi:hypothetical protein WJ0W_001533 [Paenibacillus melissococcoides]|uniref:Uncharacterized protein n=1 Tax=Paenibacillus melissococcoides TaxID=2912268 RepID=A0ABM9FYN4_9BACL|nr:MULTISPECIES: hypothetical protein [Paenibacillus]MEB9893433.1 hypothetical protein [Bacillus cereus]CAH8244295.1 hypothetical protein WJ0W_001533 [Paenibacillus melissococcoides]CAH8703487.1 hypothetical protein HTL2_000134 [Paenibacillus melissococcoides]CAH8705904.1 hypothetical protein WDD9_001095 [Paenibacillus melissococcoides]GIO77642.1 hypothetical protein J6TS7_12520 [Paenibacillus dendritiformis]